MRSIRPITEWNAAELEPLLREGEAEGRRFLTRLRAEWRSGANRFDGKGETFLGVWEDGRLVAIGGLNRASAGCGRLRRFYVRRRWRRRGLGRRLARRLLRVAAAHYSRVELRTDSADADRFYLALGFARLGPGGESTHVFAPLPSPARRPARRIRLRPSSGNTKSSAGGRRRARSSAPT